MSGPQSSPKFANWVVAASACLTAGCAVLSIDVDVYKGPLANEKHLQLQQLAVMAIAAKPLLIQLRNQLEDPRDPEAVREREGYNDAFIDEAEFLRNPSARRVNSILYLYEDARPGLPELDSLYREARAAIGKYNDGMATFDGYEESQRRWGGWQGEIWANPKWLRGLEKECSPLGSVLPERLRELQNAYAALLDVSDPESDPRRETDVLKAHGELRDLINGLAGRRPCAAGLSKALGSDFEKWRRDEFALFVEPSEYFGRPGLLELPVDIGRQLRGACRDDATVAKCVGANARFAALANTELIWLHANLLFRTDARDEKEAFVGHVTSVARSFGDSRDAMSTLLSIALKAIPVIDKLPDPVTRQRLMAGAMKFTLAVTSVGSLSLSLSSPSAPADFQWLQKELGAVPCMSEARQDRAKERLRDIFQIYPVRVSKILLRAHGTFRDSDRWAVADPSSGGVARCPASPGFECCPPLATVALSAPRRYGITRGPKVTGGDDTGENSLSAVARTIESEIRRAFTGAEGLNRGRGFEGLETLIEDFLRTADKAGAVDCARTLEGARAPDVCESKRKLIDGLVQFSEKVLFIANNEALMREPPGGDRGLFPTIERKTEQALWTGSGPNIETYTRVLQAVGNSLQVLANELHHNAERHADLASERRKSIERYALKRSQTLESPKLALDELIADVEAKAFDKTRLVGIDDVDAAAVDAAEVVRRRRDLVLAWVQTTATDPTIATDPTGRDAIMQLRQQLHVEYENAQSEPEKTKLAHAIYIVNLFPLPGETPPVELQNEKMDEDTRDVVDRLIAALEYERIEAVKRRGKGAPAVQALDQAIKLAYERRSSHIDLRPAASYLRTSFKTTALQRDASLRGRNMLARHALRQIPFMDRLVDGGIDYQTLQEIDKQFWQNINHVQVSGVGRTNYVVAKDDIGNWYVKNYSADPEDIIRGARGLAMFAAGSGLGANLLRAQPQPGAQVNEAVVAEQEVKTRTEQVFSKFQKKYIEETVSERNDLSSRVREFESVVMKAIGPMLGSGTDTLEQEVGNAVQQAYSTTFRKETFPNTADTSGEEPKPPTLAEAESAAKQILAGLREIRRFYDYADARIGGIDATAVSLAAAPPMGVDAVKQGIARARGSLAGFIRQELLTRVERRTQSVAHYQTAMSVLGDRGTAE